MRGRLLYGLGRLPFIGPDEPRYAEVAREMYVTGDWITPRLGGIKWFEKPALTYWLGHSYALFGENEFGAWSASPRPRLSPRCCSISSAAARVRRGSDI